MNRVIQSPTRFVVEDYAPGLRIDFREPAAATDLDALRESVDVEAWRGLELSELMRAADRMCRDVQVCEVRRGLHRQRAGVRRQQ